LRISSRLRSIFGRSGAGAGSGPLSGAAADRVRVVLTAGAGAADRRDRRGPDRPAGSGRTRPDRVATDGSVGRGVLGRPSGAIPGRTRGTAGAPLRSALLAREPGTAGGANRWDHTSAG